MVVTVIIDFILEFLLMSSTLTLIFDLCLWGGVLDLLIEIVTWQCDSWHMTLCYFKHCMIQKTLLMSLWWSCSIWEFDVCCFVIGTFLGFFCINKQTVLFSSFWNVEKLLTIWSEISLPRFLIEKQMNLKMFQTPS